MKNINKLDRFRILSKIEQKLIKGGWGWTGLCIASCYDDFTVQCSGLACSATDNVGCTGTDNSGNQVAETCDVAIE